VASSSSVEESERMYPGTSLVPKISSRSKSRLRSRKKRERVNHEVVIKSKRRD
jgi:hypothetical protein